VSDASAVSPLGGVMTEEGKLFIAGMFCLLAGIFGLFGDFSGEHGEAVRAILILFGIDGLILLFTAWRRG
jgi:hypothetical protein